MWIGISALLGRALQLDARKLWPHLFRLAFVGFIYFSLLGAQLQALSFGAPGKNFLQSIVILNAVFITLAGVSFFSSAITEEKEENTLGLLQMANIGPMSVLLGKSTSRLIQAFMLLMVQFPFTLLSITLGGVTMQQVLAAYIALFAYLMGLANLALFWSVVCRRTGNAAGLTTLMLVIYFAAPSFAIELHAEALRRGWSSAVWYQGAALWMLEIISQWEIVRRLWEIMSTSFATATVSAAVQPTWKEYAEFYTKLLFSPQVVTNALFGLVCFILARAVYGPYTRDVDQSTDSRGLVLRSSSNLRMFSTGRCWGNPLVWKDFHFLGGGYPGLLIKWFLYAGIFGVILLSDYYGNINYRQGMIHWEADVGIFAVTIGVFLILEISLFAARIFHDEVRMQTMSALLMLPRSIPYLGYSKAVGCLLGLTPGLFWLAVCAMWAGLNGWRVGPRQEYVLQLAYMPAAWGTILVISFFVHLTALLSLFVRWGALPLAIVVMILMTCACPIFPMMFGVIQTVEDLDDPARIAASAVLILINVVGSFVLQMMIGARLQEIGST